MGRAALTNRRQIIAAMLAVGSVLGVLTGCGKPEFTYVANSDDKTFFKVPSAWSEVDGSALDEVFVPANPDSERARMRDQLIWSTAFDASSDPTADHMISLYPTDEPVAYSLVFHVPPTVQDQISFDYLRDFFFPVTASARQTAEQANVPLTNFELLNDEILTPSDGLRGIRIVYNYELPTMTVHTFDLTAFANNDNSTLYFLLIRCTARCYRERVAEIDDVATSFTVRSQG